MFHDRRGPSVVSILVGLVMLLVPALAWMQYQWLGQLSVAERERMQRTLRTAAAQFATEFDSELSRTLISLQVDGATIRDQNWTAYAERYSRWATSAAEPRIVRDVWLVDTLPGTALPAFDSQTPVPTDRLRIRLWNPQAMTFDAAEWPDDLQKVRDSLAQRFIGFVMQRGRPADNNQHREAAFSITLGDDTTMIAPVTLFELPDDHRGPPKISILGFTIVRLEPAVLRDTMLAALTARHFHANDSEVDYRLAVVQRDDPSTLVWESEPGIASAVISAPDVSQPFMGPRPDQMFVFARGMRGDSTALPPPPPPPPPAPLDGIRDPGSGNRKDSEIRIPDPGSPPSRPEGRFGETSPKLAPRAEAGRIPAEDTKVVVSMVERDERRDTTRIITRAGQLGMHEGRWILMAKHRAGSLEAAVSAVRWRNLMISSGVLMLLTLAIGLILVSARRAQALARQQMEFVAAVSHELRTPVSVIGAAAGNLADGVVGDPQRVRKYGETIQSEARRLAETVERVLQLAGIAAGRAAVTRVPVNPADLINDSIGACRVEIEAAGFTVEVAIAENLPNVVGDVTALKSALQNLISNAVKYGGSSRWLRVSASTDEPADAHTVVQFRNWRSPAERVVFTVEDRGLGIAPEDRHHVFEPFYRGREAVSQQIQGSGLGLNLVARIAEAHGGRVTLTTEPGKGSTFTLSLPALPDRLGAEYVAADLETRPSS
jgi:two-component system sensor histidine kinase SenX3